MTLGVQVDVNLPEFRRFMTLARERQVPFATALAQTRVAKLARGDVVEGLPSKFTVRGPKLGQSIRHKPASKSDWPRTKSVVYSLATSLVLQELGGTKVPKGKDLAIPGLGTRPTKETRITKGKRPKAVLSKRGYFVGTIQGGRNAGKKAILQRTSIERYPLRVAYLLRNRAEVKKALGFEDRVRETVRAHLEAEFHKAMNEAFAKAR